MKPRRSGRAQIWSGDVYRAPPSAGPGGDILDNDSKAVGEGRELRFPQRLRIHDAALAVGQVSGSDGSADDGATIAVVRAALDHGYRCTVVSRAVATRDLPDGKGGVVDAEALGKAELAALADRFAVVVEDVSAWAG